MKRLLAMLAASLFMATPAFCLATQKTNTVNLVLANVCDGSFNDFRFQISGYDDQVFDFNYDQSLAGIACQFRITKPIDGTIYLDVPVTSITVSGTNVTFSIARTNVPPPGSYYGELLSYEATSTNIYRSIAQGKLPVTWSLYLNESNFFARATNAAAVGQVYVHPSWIDPPWLGTNAGLGSIYATLGMHTALTNWTDNINIRVTNNLASITTLQGYTNEAHTAYGWGDHSTNNYITNTTETLWPAVSNAITTNANNGATAYTWGDHASAGYLAATQSIYAALTIADRSKLGANLSGLTQGMYTGSLTSVSYTGVTVMVVGRTYAWGYTKIGADGTSTLSIASQSLLKTAAGNHSNYFTYAGTDTNLILKLDGNGLSICNVSNVYVKQITNGTLAVAGDLKIGGEIIAYGAVLTNPAAHIAQTTNAHGGIVALTDSRLTNSRPPDAHNQGWGTITGTPTTVAGYGITDGATGTPVYVESDTIATNMVTAASNYFELAKASTNALTAHTTNTIPHVSVSDRTNWDGKATLGDVAGVGYATGTPVYVESDPIWAGVSNTTVYTNDPALTNARAPLAHNQGWATITGTPTTVAGYGITDGATGTPLYVESYLGTITGATIAAGSSDSVVVTGPNAAFTWNTNAAHYVDTDTGATGITAGATDSYNAGTRTLTWNTNAAGGSGAGDNLGNHTATQRLDMASFPITNVSHIDFNSYDVAIGWDAAGSAQGVAVGGEAIGTTYGAVVGYQASGPSYGAVVGSVALGSNSGAAVGRQADGANYGAALGRQANGANYGAAVGYVAQGGNYGVAVGDLAQGTNYGVAVGAASYAATNSVAIGSGITNNENNSTVLKGNLNGMGYRSTNWVNVVETNGSGAGLTGITATQVGAYPNASGIEASNLAYTASTNAEAARVIGTNAQAVAEAALPKAGGTMSGNINLAGTTISNGVASFTALQVTGGATNNALLQSTNANGQIGFYQSRGFKATHGAGQVFPVDYAGKVTNSTISFNLLSEYNGTTIFTPTMSGYYIFGASVSLYPMSTSQRGTIGISKSTGTGVGSETFWYVGIADNYTTISCSGIDYAVATGEFYYATFAPVTAPMTNRTSTFFGFRLP